MVAHHTVRGRPARVDSTRSDLPKPRCPSGLRQSEAVHEAPQGGGHAGQVGDEIQRSGWRARSQVAQGMTAGSTRFTSSPMTPLHCSPAWLQVRPRHRLVVTMTRSSSGATRMN